VEPSEHLEVVEREAGAFAEVLRAGDLAQPVAGCPGWTLGDLGAHLGGVHRWARSAVGTEPSAGPPPGRSAAAPVGAALHPWFVEGAAELVDALREADPDRPCWSMAPPATARFWLRRQAHETTLHRWDAEDCLGAATPIPAGVALDGLDEAARMFLPRQVHLGRLSKAPEVVHLVADGIRFVLTSDAAHHDDAPLAVVTGPPDALLLLLWGRTDLDDGRLHLDGDPDATSDFLARPLTP
jgi:uncharacterized protein (TIGR03083 family)